MAEIMPAESAEKFGDVKLVVKVYGFSMNWTNHFYRKRVGQSPTLQDLQLRVLLSGAFL